MKLFIAPLLVSPVFASPDSKAGKFPKAKAAKSYGNMCMSTSSSMSMSVGPEPPITPSPTPAPTTSGVFLSAKGGDNGEVRFGEEFNSLKVDGSTALVIIRGGSLDASSSGDNGLVVNNDGSAYVCKADLIKGGTCTQNIFPCATGDGSPGVLLSDPGVGPGDNPLIRIVNARIEGGNAAANGLFGGAGLYLYKGQAEIVSKKSSIVGGLNSDGTSRWVAIDNDGSLYVYKGHIGDAITGRSMENFGSAYIYGGKWMGGWRIAGPTKVYGTNLELNVSDKLTGTLCDGNEINIQVQFQGGNLNLVENCDDYEDYVTTLPYSECE